MAEVLERKFILINVVMLFLVFFVGLKNISKLILFFDKDLGENASATLVNGTPQEHPSDFF
jgi:hypothetical protein